MENTSMWGWDNADARIISSVYRDAETETETETAGVKPVEAKTAETEVVAEKSATETKNQSEPEMMKAAAESGTTTQHVETNTTEIQPVVLSQNIQQDQGEKRERSSQNQGTNYKTDFSDKDISENKITAMAAYLLGPLGIIIALLMSAESPYAKFHVRQALKLTVSSVVLEIFAAVFALFGMIPFVGIIFKLMFVLIGAAWLGVLVIRLIAITQVCDGEAREPAVVGSFNFFQ